MRTKGLRCLSILLLSLCAYGVAKGQTSATLSGRVTSLDGHPISDVVVKATQAKRMLAFTTTNAEGRYSLTFSAEGLIVLSFRHLSFAGDTLMVTATGQPQAIDMVLTPSEVSLQEVKVKAPPVRLEGDTIKYTLAQFATTDDVTLEDGLKRIPGMEIDETGAISFMGKGISNFYIEGLDLLGGRYNLATRGIPVDYASQVEVLTHHHDKRIDRDEESEEVAVNVRLSKKAKFRPFGKSEAGLGWQEDELRYGLGLTGLLFNKDFQTICAAKASNQDDFASYDMNDHAGGDNVESKATQLLGSLSGGESPQGHSRYRRDVMATANTISRLDTATTLRVNASYTFQRSASSVTSTTEYDLGDGQTIVGELTNTMQRQHKPSLNLRYVKDQSDNYWYDELKLAGNFAYGECPVTMWGERDDEVWQQRQASSLRLRNDLLHIFRVGTHKMRIFSQVGLTRTPRLKMSLGSIRQTAQSTGLYTDHYTSFTLRLGSGWRINLPLSLMANYDFIEAMRMADAQASPSRLNGWTLSPRLSPGTDWRSRNQRLFIEAALGVRWISMMFTEHVTSQRTQLHKLYVEPSAHLRYATSPMTEWHLRSALTNSTGDLLDLLTTPAQTSFRTQTAGSGILAHNRVWGSSAEVKHNIPLRFLSLTASVAWNQSKCDVMAARQVTGSDVSESALVHDNTTHTASAKASVSKNILPIYTKVTLAGEWNWYRTHILSQQTPTTLTGQNWSGQVSAQVSPLSWTELDYTCHVGRNTSRHSDVRRGTWNIQHAATLTLRPSARLSFYGTLQQSHQRMADKTDRDFTLLDAGARYKCRRYVLTAELDNLLDTRHYAYSYFSGTATVNRDHDLCGRSFFISIAWQH